MKLQQPLNRLLKSKCSLQAALSALAVVTMFVASASNAFTNAPTQTTTPRNPSNAANQQPAQPGVSGGYILPDVGSRGAADASRDNQSTQLIGAGLNVAAAGMYASMCGPHHPTPCYFAAVASGAAGLLGLLSRGSGVAAGDVSAYDPIANPPGWGGPIYDDSGNIIDPGGGGIGIGDRPIGVAGQPPGGLPAGIIQDLTKVNKMLRDKGVSISPDGKVTLPDGRTFDTNAGINSESAALAAGFTRAEWADGMAGSNAIKGKLEKKFEQMKQLASAGGGGGRGIASEGGGGGESGYDGFDPFGRNANAHKRKKASVSGLTKKLGSDTIGVSGDNIFEMVSRRYKARDANSEFLKN